MDVAGPVQAFAEAGAFTTPYDIRYIGATNTVASAQGIAFTNVEPLCGVGPGDRVVVPGFTVGGLWPPREVIEWLRVAAASGAQICSVCTGAFALARAGLLDGRRCTTHWRRADELAAQYPRATVFADRLFIVDGPIVTSAGIAAGIDMALALLESDGGPVLASHVAREMVVYLRRDGGHAQESVYLDFQTHMNPGVHRVQQFLINNSSEQTSLTALAGLAATSERNLTRIFKQATGITVQEFRNRLRLERARQLLRNPDYTVERVATACGFASAHSLRRVWKAAHGSAPRAAPHNR